MKKICIIGGAGHIGLPLALKFSEKKFLVNVIDINKNIIKGLNKSIFPFYEKGAEKILKNSFKKKKISFNTDYAGVSDANFIIITVGTPLIKDKPSLKQVFDVFKQINKFLHKDQSIILRSTVFPGATRKIYNKLLRINKNIGLSYCPERVAQGKSIEEIKELTQIVSSNSSYEEKKIVNLFREICNNVVISSYEEAEFIKLFSNAWRYIKFAAANEFYMLCKNKNLNFSKIHNLMTINYPRNKGIPTQGFAAGPCLPKDAIQLTVSDKKASKLLEKSHTINENLPNFFVKELKKRVNIKGKTIGVLGTAFKSEIDDERDSLSIKLINILKKNGAKVICNDPYIKNKSYKSINYIKKNCKIIFIATPHSVYKNIKFTNKMLIDCWDFLKS